MKNFYTIIASIFLVHIYSFASNFNLKVNTSSNVTVLVNSQTQTSQSNNFSFVNIQGGYTFVKVYDTWTGNIIFQNNVNIAINSDVSATLDQFGNMNIYMVTPIANQQNFTTVGTVTYNNQNNNNTTIYYPNNNNQYNNSVESFNQFLVLLKDEPFDSNKLKVAQTYVSKTNLYSNQIKQICLEFSFDSYRLDFAKSAYATCIDKANYVLLKDAFSFTSNYNSLMEYVKTH